MNHALNQSIGRRSTNRYRRVNLAQRAERSLSAGRSQQGQACYGHNEEKKMKLHGNPETRKRWIKEENSRPGVACFWAILLSKPLNPMRAHSPKSQARRGKCVKEQSHALQKAESTNHRGPTKVQ